MKLAKVRYTDDGIWFVDEPYSMINQPPMGTIVQYELDVNEGYEVYFPGIPGYAPMDCGIFSERFEDLDNETG